MIEIPKPRSTAHPKASPVDARWDAEARDAWLASREKERSWDRQWDYEREDRSWKWDWDTGRDWDWEAPRSRRARDYGAGVDGPLGPVPRRPMPPSPGQGGGGGTPPSPPHGSCTGGEPAPMGWRPRPRMHSKGGGAPPPPPLHSAQPMSSHCPPDAKCRPQWHL